MKSILIPALFLFILCFTGAHAQRILTKDLIQTTGQQIEYIQAVDNDSIMGIEALKTGANLNWDFSSVVDSGRIEKITTYFLAPENTPYVDSFPTATYASTTDSLVYEYFRLTDTEFQFLGSAEDTTVSTYTNLTTFKFPFAYQDTHESIAQFYETTPNTFQAIEAKVITKYSGYGNLRTPYGEFENVVQLTVITEFDFIFASVFQTKISFIHPDYPGDIATYTWTVIDFIEFETTEHEFSYYHTVPNSRKASTPVSLLKVYPNPTSGTVKISFFQSDSSPTTIEVRDMMGKLIWVILMVSCLGLNEFILSLNLPAGMYNLSISTKTGITSQKLVLY